MLILIIDKCYNFNSFILFYIIYNQLSYYNVDIYVLYLNILKNKMVKRIKGKTLLTIIILLSKNKCPFYI